MSQLFGGRGGIWIDFWIYLGYFICRRTKECVCSPSCCVGLIFSISSPLMLTMMIWVVQLDRPGSRQVTAIQTITSIPTLCVHEIKMSMELLFPFHRWPLNLSSHAEDRNNSGSSCNQVYSQSLCDDTWSNSDYFPFVAGFFFKLPQGSSLCAFTLIDQPWAEQRRDVVRSVRIHTCGIESFSKVTTAPLCEKRNEMQDVFWD